MVWLWMYACTNPSKVSVVAEDTSFVDSDADDDGYLDSEDCDDSNPDIYPNAVEVCDGIDNNCNNEIDEGVLSSFYADQDGDGYGSPENTVQACNAPAGYLFSGSDCNDDDAFVFPGATELCDDIDNDCDGTIDEDLGLFWYIDTDGDGFGGNNSSIQSCEQPEGYIAQGDDCNDNDNTIFPGALEFCDGIDNNCNEEIDETGTIIWYLDSDNDGFGAYDQPMYACTQPQGYVDNLADCDDADTDINPNAIEVCDAVDNDCNGISDDSAVNALTWYLDSDMDGFGIPTTTFLSCVQPFGYSSNALDCDDSRMQTSPVSLEYCNGIDDNCDGMIDDNTAIDGGVYFADTDGDGFGNPFEPIFSCTLPTGYAANNQDCNDSSALIYPYAEEHCDGIDENCNTLIDELASDRSFFYQDTDGDGYGSAVYSLSCDQPSGFVTQNGDCDDSNINTFPTQQESCNGLDDNCDGAIDEGIPTIPFYKDTDGDGFGAAQTYNCRQPTGYVSTAGDCDDSDALIFPNSQERCNGLDDDCDGTVDAGGLGLDELCAADSCLDILNADATSADGFYYIDFVSGIELAECDMGSFGGGWTQVFLDDMDPPDSGWSFQSTYNCGIWGRILGGYNLLAGGSINNTVGLRSVPHTEVWVEMDYITLDSWDGELAYVDVNGSRIWGQGQNNHESIYGEVCGWNRGYYGSFDSRHYVSTILSGTFSSIQLVVGSQLNQAPSDESFGLDDVYVWVR